MNLAIRRSPTIPFLSTSFPHRLRLNDFKRLGCRRFGISTFRSQELLEEQTPPYYNKKRYYPVEIGEKLKDRYRIITKLGYGAYSTVWLAEDERCHKYTTLKVCVQDESESSPIQNEIKMLRHLSEHTKVDHPGIDYTRLATDICEVESKPGRHYCIASKPQGPSLRILQERFQDAKLPKILVKSFINRVLVSVNWLHVTCDVVHTGEYADRPPALTATNNSQISRPKMSWQNQKTTQIADFLEEEEAEDPSVPITTEAGTIYTFRNVSIELTGIPIVTDFGQSRPAEPMNKEWLMPDLYRAPEVLLGLPWSYPVDIWSIGVMMLELLEGKNLFDPIDHANNQHVLPLALAQYIGYLGPPPLHLIKQSPLFPIYFDEEGNWKGECPIPETSLEDFVTIIPPGDEKRLFLNLVRKMLTSDPEVRQVTKELIDDEWLITPVPMDF